MRKAPALTALIGCLGVVAGCGGSSSTGPGTTFVNAPKRIFAIPSSGMEPTLNCAKPAIGCLGRRDDRVVVQLGKRLKRLEIVVFTTPQRAATECGEGGTFVKRLIGMPGETVRQDDFGFIWIRASGAKNWVKLDEPYVRKASRLADTEHFGKTWHVPKGDYFMVGDNRAESCDSRIWGSVPAANVIGPVVKVLRIGVIAATAAAASPPPGATARCRDGTYSYSKHRSGTCSHHGGVTEWLTGSGSSAGGSKRKYVRTGPTILLGHRTRTSGCRRSALPDRRCTPGGYYSRLTKSMICSSSFRTGTIRNVPQSEKFTVEREYRMAASYYGFSIEIDHIVPLELGGSNSIANLFPEPGNGRANYHVKDEAENRARAWVCEGRLSLRTARHGFATNWERLYKRLFGRAPGT